MVRSSERPASDAEDAPVPLEIELKLELAPADLWRLQRHPALHGGSGSRSRRPVACDILSIYYDTPDFSLKQRGVALRLRRAGTSWVQTVKQAGSNTGGLHRRPEWETDTLENTLDFGAVGDPALRRLLSDPALQSALYPVFTTRFHRSARLIDFPGGDQLEFCIDRGEIEAHGAREPICEVELELRQGNPMRLFELALSLQADLALRAEPASKAERGYRLARGETVQPIRAAPSTLARSDTSHAAIVKALAGCLAHLQANESGAIQGADPEFVHQVRVALRRMRSILGIFTAHRDLPAIVKLREELRWVAGELNDARNWDVFRGEWLAPALAGVPQEAALWLEGEVAQRAAAAHARARAALSSPRFRRMVLEVGAFLATPPWTLAPDAPALDALYVPVRNVARRVLRRRDRVLRNHGAQMAVAGDAERHAARIAAKKLRYAFETLAPLYAAKPVRALAARLADLQDILGSLNDIATAETLVAQLPPAGDPTRAQGLWQLRGYLHGAARSDAKHLADAWAAYAACRPVWK